MKFTAECCTVVIQIICKKGPLVLMKVFPNMVMRLTYIGADLSEFFDRFDFFRHTAQFAFAGQALEKRLQH